MVDHKETSELVYVKEILMKSYDKIRDLDILDIAKDKMENMFLSRYRNDRWTCDRSDVECKEIYTELYMNIQLSCDPCQLVSIIQKHKLFDTYEGDNYILEFGKILCETIYEHEKINT